MNPLEFWHHNLGRHLCPDPKPGEDATIRALSQVYRHATKNSVLRLGGGKAASLVMDGRAILMAEISLPEDAPGSLELDLKPATWRTIPDWKAEIIMNPPDPPFMFVIYGKNPYIQNKLTINATTDLVEISGTEQERYRPAAIREALAAIGTLPATVWRKAAFLNDQLDRDPLSPFTGKRQADLDRLCEKHPTLSAVMDVLPPFGSTDYDAITLIYSVMAKAKANAKASAVKAAKVTRPTDEVTMATDQPL